MFCLTTFISSLFLINSNNSDIKNVRLNLYPSVEELKNLKEKDLKEFNRKMNVIGGSKKFK